MAGGVVSNIHWTIVSNLYIYNVVCRYGPVCCLWHLYIVVFRSFSVLYRVVLFLNKLFYLVSYVVLCHWIIYIVDWVSYKTSRDCQPQSNFSWTDA